MPTQPLNSKAALVTGGSRGIGAAIAKRLARDGASVALTYTSKPEKADALVQEIIAEGGAAIAVKADSADEIAVQAAVAKAAKAFGKIDILVNNAGVATMAAIENFSLADFDRTMSVNIRGVFVAIQAALAHMPSGSRIINLGSCNADRMPFAGGAVYAMSKAALVGLVKGLARDLGPRGITVNNVQPGPVDTDMNPADGPFAETLRTQFSALARYGKADEIAGFVAYLAGPEAGYITGASLTIDGGFNA